jgi:hypothetical protein
MGEMFLQYKSTLSFPSTAAVAFGKADVAFRVIHGHRKDRILRDDGTGIGTSTRVNIGGRDVLICSGISLHNPEKQLAQNGDTGVPLLTLEKSDAHCRMQDWVFR